MRVLITGATGVYGRELAGRLRRSGHQVVGMARRPPRGLDDGIEFVQGDVTDPAAVTQAMRGCDVVAHLAFVVSPIHSLERTREINVGGTTNVLSAMADTGCDRLVFTSSVLAYGANPDNPPLFTEGTERRPAPEFTYATAKRDVEDLITASGVHAVMTRTAATVGRDADNMILDFFGTPAVVGVREADLAFQFVHGEDVGRFLALACEGDGPAGPVNISPSDVVPLSEIADILGKPLLRVPRAGLIRAAEFLWAHDLAAITPGEAAALSHLPIVDTTKMREQWGFECAWSTREGIRDMRRGLGGRLVLGRKHLDMPWRLRFPTRRGLLASATQRQVRVTVPPQGRGELDTTHDTQAPFFTRLTEGDRPAPALILTLHRDLLRQTASCLADAFGLDQSAHDRHVAAVAGIAAHRVYVNDDILLTSRSAMRHQLIRAGYRAEVARLVSDPAVLADGGENALEHLPTAPDAWLEALLASLRDRWAWAWAVSATGTALAGEQASAVAPLAIDPVEAPPGSRADGARRSGPRDAAIAHSAHVAGLLGRVIRERASRLADVSALASPGDVAHLTWSELLRPPADATATIARRREEHERLTALDMPRSVALTPAGLDTARENA